MSTAVCLCLTGKLALENMRKSQCRTTFRSKSPPSWVRLCGWTTKRESKKFRLAKVKGFGGKNRPFSLIQTFVRTHPHALLLLFLLPHLCFFTSSHTGLLCRFVLLFECVCVSVWVFKFGTSWKRSPRHIVTGNIYADHVSLNFLFACVYF